VTVHMFAHLLSRCEGFFTEGTRMGLLWQVNLGVQGQPRLGMECLTTSRALKGMYLGKMTTLSK
jgi:hypothetical protein